MYVKNRNNIQMTVSQINENNRKIKKKMDADGMYFLHQFSINDDNMKIAKKDTILYPLRYMSGNDNITKDDIDNLITYLDKIITDIGDE